MEHGQLTPGIPGQMVRIGLLTERNLLRRIYRTRIQVKQICILRSIAITCSSSFFQVTSTDDAQRGSRSRQVEGRKCLGGAGRLDDPSTLLLRNGISGNKAKMRATKV